RARPGPARSRRRRHAGRPSRTAGARRRGRRAGSTRRRTPRAPRARPGCRGPTAGWWSRPGCSAPSSTRARTCCWWPGPGRCGRSAPRASGWPCGAAAAAGRGGTSGARAGGPSRSGTAPDRTARDSGAARSQRHLLSVSGEFLLVLLAGAVPVVPAAPFVLLALAGGQLALPALGERGALGAPHGDLARVRGAGRGGVDGGHLLAPVEHGPQLGDLEAVFTLGRVVPDDALPVDGHAAVVQGDLVAVLLDGEAGLPVAGVVPVPSPGVELLVLLAHRSTSGSAERSPIGDCGTYGVSWVSSRTYSGWR